MPVDEEVIDTSHVSGVLVRGTHGRSQWKAILSKLGQNTTPAKASSFTGITWNTLLPVVLAMRRQIQQVVFHLQMGDQGLHHPIHFCRAKVLLSDFYVVV